MSAYLANLEAGDEVIVPSFAFVTTAGAYVTRGARPVFVDVRPDTLNIDAEAIEPALTDRTKAIVVLHYAGVACDMDPIMALADERGIPVIEDNAHGLFAGYKDRQLGTIGALATQSFHETKNFSCGEGGALIVNDPGLVDRATILREKGTDRRLFQEGRVDKYTWVDYGSSYVPSDILAAYLLAQLEERDAIQAARKRIWETYAAALGGWAAEQGVRVPTVPAWCDQAFHMFYMLLPSPESRRGLIEHLASRGVLAVFHYQPLHLSKMGMRFGGRPGDCPVTEHISARLLRLPFYNQLGRDEQEEVIDAVTSFSAR